MRKIVSFMHVSLDSLTNDKDGRLDWAGLDEEIFDYVKTITDQCDTALYGRVTFDLMEDYWPTAADQPNPTRHDLEHSAWYKQVSKIVISRTMKTSSDPKVRFIGERLGEEIQKVKDQPGRTIVIFGSPSVVSEFTRLNLIDEYWLFINPVVLGKGLPLFKNISVKKLLKPDEIILFSCGVALLKYISLP